MFSKQIVFTSIIILVLCITMSSASCLWWSDKRKTFLGAYQDCAERGGRMASFKLSHEMKELRNRKEDTWIGLDSLKEPGVFRSHDDNSVVSLKSYYALMYFSPGEPKGPLSKEQCIHFYKETKKLASDPCWYRKMYVCDVC